MSLPSQNLLFISLMVFSLLACGKKEGSPAKPEAAPTVAATAPSAPPPATTPQVPSPAGFDGFWVGSSGENLPVSFTVEGNQVTSLSASYMGQNGSCSYNGNFSSETPSPLQGKTFSAQGRSPREAIEFTATGTFSSPTEASGTLVFKGQNSLCGAVDLKYQWTAKKRVGDSE